MQVYLAKLKHDNYYWCFPIEKSKDYAIHDVIDFVHNKVRGKAGHSKASFAHLIILHWCPGLWTLCVCYAWLFIHNRPS